MRSRRKHFAHGRRVNELSWNRSHGPELNDVERGAVGNRSGRRPCDGRRLWTGGAGALHLGALHRGALLAGGRLQQMPFAIRALDIGCAFVHARERLAALTRRAGARLRLLPFGLRAIGRRARLRRLRR